MPTLEERLRQIMTDETAHLHAAPDLVERVIRSSRRRRRQGRLAALATSLAVVAAAPLYVAVAPGAMQAPAISETPLPPPPIDDTPPLPSEPPSLGDLGDGREFGHVKVGYLPDGLRWSHWSADLGDRYTTAWNYDGDSGGFYCVQIHVYEGAAVQMADDQVRAHRDEGEGREVAVGDRSGYLVVEGVGEDGMEGTPTLTLDMGERRRVSIMFSPTYAKKFPDATAVDHELIRIAEGLTADH
ncbi:hypothetical protein GBF35_45470 [Nonomuraea phyllanthi]|uniref:hypothetical protein n=1 Tax=Nonomuraea phyllanthi TaxID=2219224 RepID=UPI001292F93C|nr:hypothetical protein [Nonomuraea phyllanthi]QFY12860.1 hypothetical protein GBF35_45470 [Nonomuraea phyllanthi]